jgi:hypothetical protein
MNKIKQLFSISLLILAVVGLQGVVNAQTVGPSEDPEQLVQDTECITSKVAGIPAVFAGTEYAACSRVCPRKCLYTLQSGYSVRYNGFCIDDPAATPLPYACRSTFYDPKVTEAINKVNLLGLDIDRAVILAIRRVMLLVFGAAGVVIIGLGMFATYKFSFSEGNQDKVSEAVKIFRSLVIGAIILFSGVVLIQVVATVTGVTGSLLDFDFIPRSGRVVILHKEDLGKKCFLEQIPDVASNGSEQYKCDPETLTWVE